ncbi:MAG: NADH-quinone oxidoreductase subunit NuoG [Chloroflexi bacterium]|nr:NADH-quinone oxidoreductase subunit NuoG [Chloroflexota bacterium]
MSETLVRVTIDGREVSVPKGMLIVDAAKKLGIDIPVFCYHPKMKPVGMCRMCLVEVGRPQRDRATGQVIRNERGQPVMQFAGKLETACTTPVEDGWEIRVDTPLAREGRRQVVEFLLTSHPLDCPVCDKGGECPLQNQTMTQGAGTSRFVYDDKQHLAKKVPLGDLIFLDRERCIQCARCVRFQEEIAGDPVIGFYERGRKLEIVTFSEPGFDSVFSGNTTDICPVGALTTADFRFGARPWEMNSAASICPHCPVGCNLTLNTRREAKSGGREVVKRVMPRQNEAVNELWICDKGRFGHAFASDAGRLTRPLVRRNGALVEASWEEALARASEGLQAAHTSLVGIAGGRASNEDLFNFRRLIEALGGKTFLHSTMSGGEWVQKVGLGSQADLGRFGRGDAVLVVASDLHQEAPLWWLRLKQAAERGATLVVLHPRPTRLDPYATHVVRSAYGQLESTFLGLLNAVQARPDLAKYSIAAEGKAAAAALAAAHRLAIFFGQEGLDFEGTEAVARTAATLLTATGHAGRPDCGLVAVWPQGNVQGAWDVGVWPDPQQAREALAAARGVLVMAADPLGDDPSLAASLPAGRFWVVQELRLTETARHADVVLPAQSFIEREGSTTTGERRVQRFYPAVRPVGETLPDFEILARIGKRAGVVIGEAASLVLQALAADQPDYAGVSYPTLAQVEPQWPLAGGDDLYLGGTAYKNKQGLGVALSSAAERGEPLAVNLSEPQADRGRGAGLLLVPIARLLDRGATLLPSTLLHARMAPREILLHPEDAGRLAILPGQPVQIELGGQRYTATARLDSSVPPGAALVPRSVGLPIDEPARAEVSPMTEPVAP